LDIQKDVPLNPLKRYRFAEMAIGDSMFFDTLQEVESAASAAYSFAKTHGNGFRVTRRKVEGGYRLWRVA
jgi:hypothetical protein